MPSNGSKAFESIASWASSYDNNFSLRFSIQSLPEPGIFFTLWKLFWSVMFPSIKLYIYSLVNASVSKVLISLVTHKTCMLWWWYHPNDFSHSDSICRFLQWLQWLVRASLYCSFMCSPVTHISNFGRKTHAWCYGTFVLILIQL